jgi:exodeoxyribonuclease VII large subunit
MATAIHRALKTWQQSFTRLAHTLDALSPLAVLERGYAVCLSPEGTVVRSAGEVEIGDDVKVRLHQGSLMAKVSGKDEA